MLHPLDLQQFTTERAAIAAGVSPFTLRTQLRREDIVLAPGENKDLRHPGIGRTRLWSARRVLHVALTEELARVGVSVKLASKLALQFSDLNGCLSNAGMLENTRCSEPRRPACLLADKTVFRVLYPCDGAEPIGGVDSEADAKHYGFYQLSRRFRSVILIDLDDLVQRTLAALGLPEEIVQ